MTNSTEFPRGFPRKLEGVVGKRAGNTERKPGRVREETLGQAKPSTEGIRGAAPPAEGTFTTESDGGTSSPPAADCSCADSRGAPLSVAEQQLAPAATPGAGAGASLERDGGGAGAPSRPPQDVDAAGLTDPAAAAAVAGDSSTAQVGR